MSWSKNRSTDETLAFIQEVSALCSTLGGPKAKALHGLMSSGNLKGVLEYPLVYEDSDSLDDLVYARQIMALVEKQSYLDLGYDQAQRAFEKFMEMEERCKVTNARLLDGRPNGRVAAVLHGAQRKIAEILGDVPILAALDFSFGPGASTNVKAAKANFKSKLSASPTCSYEMLPFVGQFLKELPLYCIHHGGSLDGACAVDRDLCFKPDGTPYPSMLDGGQPERPKAVRIEVAKGKLQFVPKNSKIHRPIVVEPTLNGMCQKGIGSYIKQRLRKFGVDLRTQERNRSLARKGSLDGRTATIDLSSASDTIAYVAVMDLLPFGWFDLLANCRTGTVNYGDQTIELEKFSSMGNGYTFELETLIFYSVAVSTCNVLGVRTNDVTCFGDDIIVPTEVVALLYEVLDYLGFLVNEEKSFIEGPFRESCGADWFKGIDIRPFYLREKVSDRVLYTFHNWAVRNGEFQLAKLIHAHTLPQYRLYGPDGYGDGHLVGTFVLNQTRRAKRSGWCGGFFETYASRPRRLSLRNKGDWLVPSYSVYTRASERDPLDPDIVRGSGGYAKMSIYTLATTVFCRNSPI